MKQNPPFIVTSDSATIIVDNKPYTLNKSNAAFNEVLDRINRADFDGIEKLFDVSSAVEVYTENNIVVKDGTVLYKGQPVHNYTVDKILDFMREGSLSYKPLLNFLDKLLLNPSYRAVQELYPFLEAGKCAICADGDFIAFRKVTKDWKDFYTGTFDNSIGAIVEMPRNMVDEDKNRTCRPGLHFCSQAYLSQYHGNDGRVVLVKINPADVCAIPSDYNNAKGRCCKYQVISECAGGENGQTFGPLYVRNAPDEVETEDTDSIDAAEEKAMTDCYEEAFDLGYLDAEAGYAFDPAYSWENEAGFTADYAIFCEGYESGFNEYEDEEDASIPSVTDDTRVKLSKAAKKQTRDSSGRFC